MDPWDIVTKPNCQHDAIEVEPGMTTSDPCVGYCQECGERILMHFSWTDYILECDFNKWAKRQIAASA